MTRRRLPPGGPHGEAPGPEDERLKGVFMDPTPYRFRDRVELLDPRLPPPHEQPPGEPEGPWRLPVPLPGGPPEPSGAPWWRRLARVVAEALRRPGGPPGGGYPPVPPPF